MENKEPHIPVKAGIPSVTILILGFVIMLLFYPGYGLFDELPKSANWAMTAIIVLSIVVLPISIRYFTKDIRAKEALELEELVKTQIEKDKNNAEDESNIREEFSNLLEDHDVQYKILNINEDKVLVEFDVHRIPEDNYIGIYTY